MKAKTFIRNLSQYIFEEYKQEIPIQQLRSSFVEAIKSISPGELQDKLNNNFDKNLKKLEKNLKSLCVRELPSVSNVVDDSLEELTKSELDGRTDVEEHSTKHSNRLVYDVMKKELKKPNVEAMKNMDETQRCIMYRTFIQKVLNRDDLPETFLDTVLKEFDDVCEVSKNKKSGKSKFDWFPMCELLLQLVTGSKPVAFIRVLKILFDAIQNDVNKCIASQKVSRTEKLCKILKRFLNLFHFGIGLKNMTESETKMYCRYMSGMLSFYVDLSCACSSTVVDKKRFGRELAGYVCLLLQPWPESLLDVGLQVQGMEDENCKILLPLINKCLETKPVERRHNVYYLKYVLLVRKVKDAYLEVEDIQDWNLATKSVPAKTDFLDWLDKECPEAMEYIPHEDKKFRKTKITRFLLEEAEDDLITVLVDSLSKDDKVKDVYSAKKVEQETGVTMDLENLFYLDTGGEQADWSQSSALAPSREPETIIEKCVKKDETDNSVISELEKSQEYADSVTSASEDDHKIRSVVRKVSPKKRKDDAFELSCETDITEISADENENYVHESSVENVCIVLQAEPMQNDSKSSQDELFVSEGAKSKEENRDSVIKLGSPKIEVPKSTGEKLSNTSQASLNSSCKPNTSTVSEYNPSCVSDLTSLSDSDLCVINSSDISSVDQNFTLTLEESDQDVTLKNDGEKPKTSTLKMVSDSDSDELSDESQRVTNDKPRRSSRKSSSSEGKDSHNKSDVKHVETDLGVPNERKRRLSRKSSSGDGKDNLSRSYLNQSSSDSIVPARERQATSSNEEEDNDNVSPGEVEKESDQNVPTDRQRKLSKKSSTGDGTNSSSFENQKHSDSCGPADRQRRLSRESSLELEKNSNNSSYEVQKGSDASVSTSKERRQSRKSSSGDEKDKRNCSYNKHDQFDLDVSSDRPRRLSRKSSSGEEKGNDSFFKHGQSELDVSEYRPKKSSSGEEKGNVSVDKQDQFNSGISVDRPRRLSRKSSSGEEKVNGTSGKKNRKSPRSTEKDCSRVAEIHTEDESDGDVFQKTPEKKGETQLGGKTTISLEDKFISKAIKGRKTPKKVDGQGELYQAKKEPGSVTLFTDENVSESVVENGFDEEASQRTKSTEEIFQIVEEIKEKIKTPHTSKGKETHNESMFTDDSVESSQEDLNVSVKEVKSPEMKTEVKSVVESDEQARARCKSTSPAGIKDREMITDSENECNAKDNAYLSLSPGNEIGNNQQICDVPEITEDSENREVVIDLIDEETDQEQEKSENETKSKNLIEPSDGKLTEKTEDILKTDKKSAENSMTDNPELDLQSKNSPKQVNGEKSNVMEGSYEKTADLGSPSKKDKHNSDKETNTSLQKSNITELINDTNTSSKTMLENKATNERDQNVPEVESEEKDNDYIEITTDNDSEIENSAQKNVTTKTSYVVTDNETDSDESSMKIKTPEHVLHKKGSSPNLSARKRTPKSGEVDEIEQEEIRTPKEKNKVMSPKSGSKSASKNINSPSIMKTPNSEQKKMSSTKSRSSSGKRKHVDRCKEEENVTCSDDDFVPSSQKRTRTKSNIFGSNTTTKTVVVESDEDLTPIPDLGVHLKTGAEISETSDKSQVLPTKKKAKSPNGIDDKNAQTRRSARKKSTVEQQIVSVGIESDVDGPSRPKRLRSASKTVPDTATAKSVPSKRAATRSDLSKVYESQSETDTTEVSDFEPRRTRKSVGGLKLTKEKIPEEDEDHGEEPHTPRAQIKQRKVSASTSKKAVKKKDAVRGTRKRRLSGEFSDQSGADSEVPFPEPKPITASEKKLPKRTSTPAVQSEKEPPKETTGRRYSLRKK